MAWYEEQDISFDYVEKIVNKNINKEEKIPEWIVQACLKDEYKKYNGFGSYRGFYSSSTLSTIMKDIRNKNRALQTLSRPLKIWMNTILYRPPDKYNNSLRYEEVKANFENNKTKQHH